MYVSHKYRFIFFRTEKTASTSLMRALKAALGDDGIESRQNVPKWLGKYSPVKIGTLQKTLPNKFGLPIHASAAQAKRVLGEEIFNSYYKIAVERNPWDRQISLYHHRRTENKIGNLDFDRDMRSWVYRAMHHTRLCNWDRYAIGENIVADRVVRFENLGPELAEVFAKIGLDKELKLDRHRANYRDKSVGYREHYTDFTRDLIGKWYQREINAFAYTF